MGKGIYRSTTTKMRFMYKRVTIYVHITLNKIETKLQSHHFYNYNPNDQ